MNKKKLRGDWGEALVAGDLRRRGYDIVASQFRCRMGEVDLIARKHGVLCFVEVKTRTGRDHGLPREAVTPRKQQRIRTAAAQYLARYDLDCPVRFDVAEVYVDDDAVLQEQSAKIVYLEAAFE